MYNINHSLWCRFGLSYSYKINGNQQLKCSYILNKLLKWLFRTQYFSNGTLANGIGFLTSTTSVQDQSSHYKIATKLHHLPATLPAILIKWLVWPTIHHLEVSVCKSSRLSESYELVCLLPPRVFPWRLASGGREIQFRGMGGGVLQRKLVLSVWSRRWRSLCDVEATGTHRIPL